MNPYYNYFPLILPPNMVEKIFLNILKPFHSIEYNTLYSCEIMGEKMNFSYNEKYEDKKYTTKIKIYKKKKYIMELLSIWTVSTDKTIIKNFFGSTNIPLNKLIYLKTKEE